MKWITFFLLLYLATALQWSRFGALSAFINGSPCIEYLPFLAIFYALYAAEDQAPLVGIVCGLVYDLGNHPMGLFTVSLALVTWLVVHIRMSVFREHLISQFVITLMAVFTFHLFAATIKVFLPWFVGHGLGTSNFPFWPTLGRGFINALYTAILAPAFVWLFFHFPSLLGFNLKNQRYH